MFSMHSEYSEFSEFSEFSVHAPSLQGGSGVGLLIAHLHRHLARLAIKAQEEPAAVSTTEIQRPPHRLGIALEALPQLIAYAIAAGHQRGETRPPPHPSRKGREYDVLGFVLSY